MAKRVKCLNWLQKDLLEKHGFRALFFICGSYFLQGLVAIDFFAINYLLKDVWLVDSIEAQQIVTTIWTPWVLKPIWGLIVDSVPIWKFSRRKSYFLLNTLLAFGFTLFLAIYKSDNNFGVQPLVVVLLLRNTCYAFLDVVMDAYLIEQARCDPENGAKNLQTLSFFFMTLGTTIASLTKGFLVEHFEIQQIFLIMAFVMPFLLFLLSLLMQEHSQPTCIQNEDKSSCSAIFCNQIRSLRSAFTNRMIYYPCLFLFLSNSLSPSISEVWFYYSTVILHLTPSFLGLLSLIASIMGVCGTVLYSSCLYKIRFRTIFLASQMGLIVLAASMLLLILRLNLDWGIPNETFIIATDLAVYTVRTIHYLPIAVLLTKLCPVGIEGTVFAGFTSILNGSYLISGYFGAICASWLNVTKKNHYGNLWLLQLIITLTKFLPFFLIFCLIPNAVNDLTAPFDIHSQNNDEIVEDEIVVVSV